MRYLFGFMCVCALGVVPLVGCGDTASNGGGGGAGAAGGGGGSGGGGSGGGGAYAAENMWLCRPDIEDDACDTVDLSWTEIRPDGTLVTGDVAANPDAAIDCFFLYSTVNNSPTPGNTETLSPTDPDVLRALHILGSLFRGVCRVFAPLYHQMSSGTYAVFGTGSELEATSYFHIAYDDVVEAFEYYMRNHNDGRDFVLLGHSQAARMFASLLEDEFDDNETLRGQLVSAMLVGHGAQVYVPDGEQVGGSLANIPLCTSANETGCVIAFNAIAADEANSPDSAIFPPGMVRACVNPASFDGGPGTLAAFIYPRPAPNSEVFFPGEVETVWVSYTKMYEAQCSDVTRRLEIDLVNEYPGEVPVTPQEFQAAIGSGTLHWAEPFITVTDLVRIVEQQAQSR
jgi:hypothetical protein